ncbi:hypothetical protein ACHQM5_010726 [Ranunculus cassubicifolius]
MNQKNSPILSTSTLMTFTILPLLGPKFLILSVFLYTATISAARTRIPIRCAPKYHCL